MTSSSRQAQSSSDRMHRRNMHRRAPDLALVAGAPGRGQTVGTEGVLVIRVPPYTVLGERQYGGR